VKPAPFDYFAPATVEEAVALLAEHGDDAKVLAGGQSLVPMMNLRLAQPAVLVDVNRIGGLGDVRTDDGRAAIGATTRHHELASSETLHASQPLLARAASFIGYPAIRERGTIGGSLAHADPVSELPCVALTLDADLVVASPRGLRTIPARDFFRGYFTTALAPDELLVEVLFPPLGDAGWDFQEFARRSGDFAVAAVAATVRIEDGVIAEARIGLAGVADRPLRATEAEAVLRGRAADGAALSDARVAVEEAVAAAAVRDDDGYTRHVAGTLAERALAGALGRAGTEVR
jgi:carbon-monoxide dehydrogenase medium subunit